ncbi:MAG: Na+:solute symporter [Acidobacteria bacterium]|nr:Na+:solute symporter [Acidobacteriota bacterium]
MNFIDWTVVAAYFLMSLAVGLYYSRRAGRDTSEFFLSGRNLPWWLAGTSMVATTFAADTPLAVTELVARNGIAGNWLWWNFLFGSTLTVFFFARLWRRANIMTDLEFIELRYSGKPASLLRGFRALYLGLFINTVIMGWVNLAMGSILQGMFGISAEQVLFYVFASMLLVAVYSALSGLWGVALTDALQFLVAMTGTIVLAVVVLDLPQVGGVSGLREQLPPWAFEFTPSLGVGETAAGSALGLSVSAFVAYLGIQWWASWYPGAEPGGGGYVAQRMMSARDERHSLLATLWFTVAHYCVRPWPWILVGLSTLVLYPDLGAAEKKLGYVYAMRDFLPPGLKGLLVAAFFAAYMSTIATQLNWGSSYVINDFYRRFVRRNASEKHYVQISRVVTLLLMLTSVLVTLVIETISGAWQFVIEAGAGLGLVLILRWYWWRINAWSEIAATLAPFGAYFFLREFTSVTFPVTLFYIVGFTTATWLVVTFLTHPTDEEHLLRFFRRCRPGGIGWRQVAKRVPDMRLSDQFSRMFVNWLLSILLVYTFLFGTGKILVAEYAAGVAYFVTGLVAGAVLYRNLRLEMRRESK